MKRNNRRIYIIRPTQIIVNPTELTQNETSLKILDNNKREIPDNDNDFGCAWGWAYDRPYDN
jgi:hypothetical protein